MKPFKQKNKKLVSLKKQDDRNRNTSTLYGIMIARKCFLSGQKEEGAKR